MQLQCLELANFNTYDKLSLGFDPGLTLVVGLNGAGKSSVIEGIVWTLHGITVRGEPPERAQRGATHGALTFAVDGREVKVARRRTKGRTDLKLEVDGEDVSGQTATETQMKIDRLVREPQQFIAARIFAKEFLQRFAAATDKERKALLEGVLGLGRFDTALQMVRTDLAVHKQALAGALGRLRERRNNLAEALARADAAPDVKGELGTLEADQQKLRAEIEAGSARAAKLDKMAREALDQHHGLRVRREKLSTLDRERQRVIAGLQQKLEQTLKHASCPVCFRELKGAEDKIKDHFAKEIEAAETERQPWAEELKRLEADMQDAEEAHASLKSQYQDAVAAMPTAKLHEVERKIAAMRAQAGERARLEGVADEVRSEVADLEKATAADESKVQMLDLTTKVLGLRGARTMLLSRALERLQGEANAVMMELGLNLLVTITGTTEQKSGKEVEAISIKLNAGSGAYGSLSSGERARVDVGFLMGLSEMMGTGFVAFDEVFDALDPDGIERVVGYLAELSKERQVLVISHHEDLKAAFPRGRKLRAVKTNEEGSTLEAL